MMKSQSGLVRHSGDVDTMLVISLHTDALNCTYTSLVVIKSL